MGPTSSRAVRDLAETIAMRAPLTISGDEGADPAHTGGTPAVDAVGDDLIAACYGSDDFLEGVAAFLAQRPPKFGGH